MHGARGTRGRVWLGLASAIVSGGLLAWAYALTPWWGAAWVAPIPVIVAAASLRWRAAAGLGAIAGAVASVSLFAYLTELSGALDALSVSAVRAAQWALIVVVVRAAIVRLPAAAAVFVLPALLAGMEVIVTLASPHGSAGSLAYSQMDLLAVIQAASLGGTAAVVFVPMLVASALVVVFVRRRMGAWLVAPVLVLALALGFGAWRLATPIGGGDAIRVALVASDQFEGVPSEWRTVWAAYEPAIATAADDDAEIIVLPEKIFTIHAADVPEFLEQASAVASAAGAAIVVGVDERSDIAVNRAFVIGPGGSTAHYDKRHLIPGFESRFSPGAEALVRRVTSVLAGIAICKDMDFPSTIRDDAAQQATVMLVPAWDFVQDGWFHARMAMLRGVENGQSVVRSAREGLLTISDAHGRVLQEAASTEDVQVLAGEITPGLATSTATVASVVGDVFGWLCVAFSVGGIAVAAVRRPGGAQSSATPSRHSQ